MAIKWDKRCYVMDGNPRYFARLSVRLIVFSTASIGGKFECNKTAEQA